MERQFTIVLELVNSTYAAPEIMGGLSASQEGFDGRLWSMSCRLHRHRPWLCADAVPQNIQYGTALFSGHAWIEIQRANDKFFYRSIHVWPIRLRNRSDHCRTKTIRMFSSPSGSFPHGELFCLGTVLA